MKCPYCDTLETRVVDSRLVPESNQVRRRRECVSCGTRFSTHESQLLQMPMVIKNDGSRVVFDEDRLRNGMLRALEKRPVPTDQVEDAINRLKKQLLSIDSREVLTRKIGELAMDELQRLDHVAYIRFASVYLSFEDIRTFQEVITILESKPTPEMNLRQVPLIDEDI